MASRNTKQKYLIEDLVMKQKGFFSADFVFDIVKEKDSGIGIATIYRNLKRLVSEGKLFAYTCDRRQVFSKTKQHCHFIDEQTGDIFHFQVENLDFLKSNIPGTFTSFQIEVRGIKKR